MLCKRKESLKERRSEMLQPTFWPVHTWYKIVIRASGAVAVFETAPDTPPARSNLAVCKWLDVGTCAICASDSCPVLVSFTVGSHMSLGSRVLASDMAN